MTVFEEVLEDTFYFKMTNESSGIVEKDVRVVQQRADGKYYLVSLSNRFEEEALDCDLKYLLMGKERRFNVMDSVKARAPSDPTFVRKVQRIPQGYILRLSNRHIQFMLEESNYLLTAEGKLFDVTGKEKEMNVGKLMSGVALKGNKEHFRLIRQVVGEIESRKEEYSK